MKSMQKDQDDGVKAAKLAPRRRGQGDVEPTRPKSYTLPFSVILALRRAAVEYGSQGRALQVGSELAIRMKKPPEVEKADPETEVRMTYKLLPRTIQLIEELADRQYGDAGSAIAACVEALKIKKL